MRQSCPLGLLVTQKKSPGRIALAGYRLADEIRRMIR
jgi:hypothetical protein